MRKRTGRITVLSTLFTAGVLWFGTTAAQAGSVNIGSVDGTAGQQASVGVTLTVAGSEMIAGTQNDITPGAGATLVAKTNGKPDCTANAALAKEGTTFGFLPAGCTGAACTGVRVLVFSISNTDPIPDGSLLYTCNYSVAASATGSVTLTNSGVTCSDPSGGGITCTGGNGAINLAGPAGNRIAIGMANGTAGQNVSVDVTLSVVAPAVIAGTQNDITPGTGATLVAKTNGKPDCTANAALGKEGTTFGFLPAGCTGAACTGVRVLVFSISNTDPIPTGSVLYSCNYSVAAGATATITLANSNVTCSDPSGGGVDCTGANGSIILGGGPTHTPGGPTSTPTPTATNTPPTGGSPTATRTGGATATRTPLVVPTATGGIINIPVDEDGCQIGAPGGSGAGWLLLIPLAAGLIVLRRRSR